MPISDLMPWRQDGEQKTPVKKESRQDALLDLREEMNQLFEEFFSSSPMTMSPFSEETSLAGDFIPHTDIKESEKEITVSAELPGMEAEDIDISITGNTLTITGKKKHEKEEKGERYYRSERSYGSFRRSIPLPDNVQEDKIEATYQQGVLNVSLPKQPGSGKGTKRIEIKKD